MPPLRLSSKQCHRLGGRRRRRRHARLLPGNQRTGVSQAAAVGAQERPCAPRASIAAARLRWRRQTVVVVVA